MEEKNFNTHGDAYLHASDVLSYYASPSCPI